LSIDAEIILECIQELHLPGDTTTFDLLPVEKRTKKKRKKVAGLLIALFLVLLGTIFFLPHRLGIDLVRLVKSVVNLK
jgi:hypothetical protein